MRGKENSIHAGISEDRRESRRELLVRKIKGFRLLDDDFMSRVFEDNIECTELLLHIIMNRDDIKVQEVHIQYSIKNLHGRSVRLDIFATDSSDRKYNFEIQRSDKGAGVKRARYNSSIIDANILDALRKMRKEWQRCAEQLRNCAMKQEMKDMLKARMKRSLRMRLSFSDRVS